MFAKKSQPPPPPKPPPKKKTKKNAILHSAVTNVWGQLDARQV